MYKVVIAGSRDFDNYELLEKETIKLLRGWKPSEVEIVSGGARGADKLGELFAKRKKCWLKVFPANWNRHGKSAGYIRNAEMSKYGDICIVFWDGISKGTKHMIDLCAKHNTECKVIKYKEM